MNIVQFGANTAIRELADNIEPIYYIDCSGTTQAGASQIGRLETIHTMIVIGKRIDASNYAINLPNIPDVGNVVEVYAEGGSIEIFPGKDGGFNPLPFFDGSSSVTTTTGKRFRSLYSPTANKYLWAIID